MILPWLNPRTRTYVLQFRIAGACFSRQTDLRSRREADAAQKAWKEEEKQKRRELERTKDAKGRIRDVTFDVLVRDYWDAEGKDAADSKTRFKSLALLVERVGPDRMASDIDDTVLTDLINKRKKDYDSRIKVKSSGAGPVSEGVTRRRMIAQSKQIAPRKLSNAYINRYVTELLKTVLNFGIKKRKYYFADMPDWRNHILDEPAREREMSHAEQAALNGVIREDYAVAYDFATLTGLRRKVVVELEWHQVDWELMLIRTVGKNRKPHTTPIVGDIASILRAQIGKHPTRVFTFLAVRTVSRNPKNGGAYVAGNRYPLNYQTFGTMWARSRKKAGVENLRIHDLRHTYASRLLRHVKDLRLVQQAMAHSDIATTTRYSHVLQEQIADGMIAAQRADAALLMNRKNVQQTANQPDGKSKTSSKTEA